MLNKFFITICKKTEDMLFFLYKALADMLHGKETKHWKIGIFSGFQPSGTPEPQSKKPCKNEEA